MYIGVDLGTSAVKLLAMNKDGTILKTVSVEYPISFPQSGWSEQNPEDWYKGSMEGISKLIAETGETTVEGIGVGGQMHGLVILDKDDNVILSAMSIQVWRKP